jgi:predicted RNA-binding Zn-ribbon protein involved in translation (DUF1610 family)
MGVDQKQKIIKEYETFPCPNCKDDPSGRLVKVYNYLHVFFVPLFKWKVKYVMVCQACRHGFEVSKEKGESVERGESDLTYWDLKPLQPLQKKCMACGANLNPDHNFCPICGQEIRK